MVVIESHCHQDYFKDLWYSKSEYYLMKLENKKDILEAKLAQAVISGAISLPYSTRNYSFEYCLVGIEHLLTKAGAVAFVEGRQRCVQAVLQEQARQKQMNSFARSEHGQDSQLVNIAKASSLESETAVLRAQEKADLLRKAILV